MISPTAWLALAAVATGLTTLAVLGLWLRRGGGMPLDVANERSLHAGAVPRIGGIAMASGVAVAIPLLPLPADLWPILLAALGLFVLSLLDDWRSLSVWPRLLGHLAASTVAVGAVGVEGTLPVVWAVPLMLALVWMTNLYNFMDGADGLAGGMAVAGFGAYAVAAWATAPGLAGLCLVLAVGAASFLTFNFPPARVFMGDAGSIPLGFLAGALGLAGWRAGVWPGWFPVLVFSVFIVDATVTLWRRLYRRQRIWQAHRQHAYQRLVLAGWSHRRLAGFAWGLMAATAGSALGLMSLPAAWQSAGLAAWALLYGGILLAIARRCCVTTKSGSATSRKAGCHE